ncbi:carbohydrate binding domain-containing protein [Lactococcus lactis]|uniref:carbohydrate binding domain-containing protein n=1 Tax=Lactococcus lactis TaxID=1358 RepID=UPI00339B30DF
MRKKFLRVFLLICVLPILVEGLVGLKSSAKTETNNNLLQNNLLVNGDFETGDASGWSFNPSSEGDSRFTVEKHNGGYQGKIYNGGEVYQIVDVSDNEKYDFSMDYSEVYEGYMLRAQIIAQDSQGKKLKTVYSESAQKASGKFEKNSLSLPAGTVSLKVSIIGSIHSESYIDNVQLDIVKPACKNLLVNGDFETGDTSGWLFNPSSEGDSRFTVEKHNGSYQGKVYNGGEVYQLVDVSDNEKYDFSMDYSEVYEGYMLNAQIVAQDSQGKKLKTIYSDSTKNISGKFEKNGLSLPAGTVSLKVSIMGAIHSETYIDNAYLGNCN